jgi:hypothetical protein
MAYAWYKLKFFYEYCALLNGIPRSIFIRYFVDLVPVNIYRSSAEISRSGLISRICICIFKFLVLRNELCPFGRYKLTLSQKVSFRIKKNQNPLCVPYMSQGNSIYNLKPCIFNSHCNNIHSGICLQNFQIGLLISHL